MILKNVKVKGEVNTIVACKETFVHLKLKELYVKCAYINNKILGGFL